MAYMWALVLIGGVYVEMGPRTNERVHAAFAKASIAIQKCT